jgi:hypothetical protein
MHKSAAQCEKRKESVSPPPERERDIPPKLPTTVYDPLLHCHYRIGEYLGKVSAILFYIRSCRRRLCFAAIYSRTLSTLCCVNGSS